MEQQAFILRQSAGSGDCLKEALDTNQLIVGWSEAKGLLDEKLSWEEFRSIIIKHYHAHDENLRRAGASAGHIWCFIREMTIGDLVVVPYGHEFYVAEITGPPTYVELKVENDTAYRRPVKWLNDKKPISRSFGKAALLSRMKSYGTCAYASDVLHEIKECLEFARTGATPTFTGDLHGTLVKATLKELLTGRMENYGFEKLIENLLLGLGAEDARVIARRQDKGVDVIATFRVAGAFRQVVAVQAKHWKPDPPVGKDVVEQLKNGIGLEEANLGMIITSGTISKEAEILAEEYFEETGIKIELVDGEQLAKLIVEHGIKTSPR